MNKNEISYDIKSRMNSEKNILTFSSDYFVFSLFFKWLKLSICMPVIKMIMCMHAYTHVCTCTYFFRVFVSCVFQTKIDR
jgi:hypothetical protein